MNIIELGGDYIAKEIIERSKDKDIIYLTEDVVLNTKCVQQLAEYLEKQQKELEEKQKSYDIAYKQGKAFENHIWKSLVRDILKKYAHTTIDDEENIINFYNEVKELLGDDK